MPIKHTKKRQVVLSFYQDPIRFHPAKVLEMGVIKINKYPQETPGEGEQWSDYKGLLITTLIRRPRWRPIGWFHFDLHINNGEGLIQKLKAYVSQRIRLLWKRFTMRTTKSEGGQIEQQIIPPAEESDVTS